MTRLLAQLPDAQVVSDPEPTGSRNPWRTYLACLRVGAELSEPFVILQDDTVVSQGFKNAAQAVRAPLPDALLAFCLQGQIHQNTRSDFWRMLEAGQHLLRIRPHNWVPAIALGWTPKLASWALEWDSQSRLRANFTSDDGRLFYFTRWAEAEVWATVPCLVDHPDDVASVGEQKVRLKPSRMALSFLEDANEVSWEVT